MAQISFGFKGRLLADQLALFQGSWRDGFYVRLLVVDGSLIVRRVAGGRFQALGLGWAQPAERVRRGLNWSTIPQR